MAFGEVNPREAVLELLAAKGECLALLGVDLFEQVANALAQFVFAHFAEVGHRGLRCHSIRCIELHWDGSGVED